MEDDIPGTPLLRWKPEELKNAELWLWIECYGDLGKRSEDERAPCEMSVWVCHNWQRKKHYIADPDPDKIYSRRKE